MHRFDYPLSSEGVRFLGSRNDHNIAQALIAHFKAGDATRTHGRLVEMLQRHWPKKQRIMRQTARAYVDTYGYLVDDPSMVNATFYSDGGVSTPELTKPDHGFTDYRYGSGGRIIHI